MLSDWCLRNELKQLIPKQEFKLKTIVYLTAVYGEKYLPMLMGFLHSLGQVREPESKTMVLWSQLPAHEIMILNKAYPWCEFIESPIILTGDYRRDIPFKVRLWSKALTMFPDAQVRFMDCDMVVTQSYGDVVEGDYDILFTAKNERVPLNTGMIVANSSPEATFFFQQWLEGIEKCAKDDDSLSEAVACNGSIDQHVLAQWLGSPPPQGISEVNVNGRTVRFKNVPCSVLNETNSKPITPEMRVIHYKAGWHPILLENKDFSKNRPEDTSLEMYNFWMDIFKRASTESLKKLVMDECAKRVERFRSFNFGYQIRGMLHSELLIVCSLCEAMGVEVLIESGRFRGQSTFVLANYFSDSDVKIESIEANRDENAAFCEQRLAPFKDKVMLNYGDCPVLLPQILRKHNNRRIAILFDGPKGERALHIFDEALRSQNGSNIIAGFFHDARRDSRSREIYEKHYERAFFSDDEEYIETFRELDKPCLPTSDPVSPHAWSPYMKGDIKIESYGPTLFTCLPLFQEKIPPELSTPPFKRFLRKGRSFAGRIKRFIIRRLREFARPESAVQDL